MQKQNKVIKDQKIRSELTTRWPKITGTELSKILIRHGELKVVLKHRYEMTKEEALKTAASFFKRFGQGETRYGPFR